METPNSQTVPLPSVSGPQRTKLPVIPMLYQGKHGEVLKLHIANLLLNIITLGIYSFWGKTRIRKYMTSHITLAQDRFEYTGTGKELFFGWMKAMLIFMPLLIGIQIPVINFIALPLFFAVISVAIFLALRYRLSRTRWRGIRFHLGGSIKKYLVLSLKRTLINIVTLGWKIPKGDILKWSYIANHITYGDLKFSFAGDEKNLQKVHLVTLCVGGLSLVLSFGMLISMLIPTILAGFAQSGAPNPVGTSTEPKVGVILFFYAGIGVTFLARIWYQAALWQEKFRGLRIGNLRFKIGITGGGLVKLYFTNILLIIFTLGIAKPIAANRTLRYFISNLRIGGDINELIADQRKISGTTGMGDALAADVGFDLGL